MLFEKLSELFELISRNKLLSTLFALVTASVGVLVENVYNGPQEEAELVALATAINNHKMEVEAGQVMVTAYDEWRHELAEHTRVQEHLLDGDALAQKNLVATTKASISEEAEVRKVGATYRARLVTRQVTNPELKELRDSMVRDIDQTDQFLAIRMEFLQSMMSNWPKAVEMADTLRHNLDGWKAGQEADARTAVIDKVIEKLRLDYNDRVAAGNAKLGMYRWRQRRVIGAFAVVGGFASVFAVWAWKQLRRRRGESEPEIRFLEAGGPAAPDGDKTVTASSGIDAGERKRGANRP